MVDRARCARGDARGTRRLWLASLCAGDIAMAPRDNIGRRRRATFPAAVALAACGCSGLAAAAANDAANAAPPPALAPGQAPPLPEAGALAGPRFPPR
jgi:hypothetical protein